MEVWQYHPPIPNWHCRDRQVASPLTQLSTGWITEVGWQLSMITFDGSLIEILMMLDGKSSWQFDRKIRALIAELLWVLPGHQGW